MNFKKVLSVVSITFLIFLVVAAIAVYSNNSDDTILFKQGHDFNRSQKINQYPRSHKCATQCIEEQKGFNCGRLSQACCEDEESCVSEWGMKKCQNKKNFDCKLV